MSENSSQSPQNEEVDLGQLFNAIGRLFEKFFSFIGSIFKKIFLSFIWFVFFLKKHSIKLAAAGVIGIVLGIVLEKTSEPVYRSSILVKQNYDTGESLYNEVNYYNDLIRDRDIKTLGSVLNIDSIQAETISSFEIEPLVNENNRVKNFNTYFVELDTSVSKTFTYKDYLENIKDYSYNNQRIIIKAKERSNFKVVFSKIIDNINSNPYFKLEQNKDLNELKAQAEAIRKSLKKSDTLLNVYQKAIVKSAENDNNLNAQITIADESNQSSTKEYELYNKDIELRQRLVNINRDIEDKAYIIEVISSKEDSGAIDNRRDLFGAKVSSKLYFFIILTSLTLIILFGFNMFKYLEHYKEQSK